MLITLIPIQCRLGYPSLVDIANYADMGVSELPVDFKVTARHCPTYKLSADELLEYAVEEFGPYTIVLTSMRLNPLETGLTLGEAEGESRVGVARSEPGHTKKWRDLSLAQTIIHEFLHLCDLDHHKRPTRALPKKYCPFMHYSEAQETSLIPCNKCKYDVRQFYERDRAA